jgi:hypothetical protein
MKHRQLQAIAHNLADSIASGCSLLIGAYSLDVFGEAARSQGGEIIIDFLHGKVIAGTASRQLTAAVSHGPEALAKLCAGHRASLDVFRELTARYWSDHTGNRFAVTVEDAAGRRSTTEYAGTPGRRVQIVDPRGRRRPKPSGGPL